MAQIKPMPVHIREYYKSMKDAYTQKEREVYNKREELIKESYELRDSILNKSDTYKNLGVNLTDYPEFVNNEYIDGKFYKYCEKLYINKQSNYVIKPEFHKMMKLATIQRDIATLKKELDLYQKILDIKPNEYIRYMREYFTLVHKKMILEGYGYHFGNGIGDVLINRVRYRSNKPTIDYKATKEKKAEILARGGRIYNEEEAKWCEQNGIEYKAEDYRVYMDLEYYYEICLLNKRFTEAESFNFNPQDYRAANLRGKSNEQLIAECDNDLNKICELQIDMKSKLHMCVEVDKMLYTNFIRNESQTPCKYAKTCR